MDRSIYQPIIDRALAEDLGLAGDLSAEGAVPPATLGRANLVARADGVVAGLSVAADVFDTVDADLKVQVLATDGDRVSIDQVLIEISGSARSLLTAERTALNLICLMSGVATATARLVEAVSGTNARIADTRKTIPGLRALQKYAVRMGGGINHRFGLSDAVMIKDNHLLAGGGVRPAVEAVRARVGHTVTVEVEVTSLEQLRELLEVGADIVLLDNMDLDTLAEAIRMVDSRMVTEASGGITVESAAAIAATGVDVLSSGWITHSAPALDMALDFQHGAALGLG